MTCFKGIDGVAREMLSIPGARKECSVALSSPMRAERLMH